MDHPLKRYRMRHGLTLEALGEHLGVSKATVCRWEGGERFPNALMMQRIAKVTGGSVTPNDMVAAVGTAETRACA
jgi:transcriptional regulator with XRE-family HTH domain